MNNLLADIGIIIIISGLFGYLARLLKQPLIPTYIIVGIIIGPLLHLVTDRTTISSLSEIGIAFMLFSVGLELDMKKLKDIGTVASIGSTLQMMLVFGASYAAFMMLGYASKPSAYIGMILMFSSTLVVAKLLSDKNELDTLHGRIIIGMLLMQDIIAIICLSIINSSGKTALTTIAVTFAEGAVILVIGWWLAKLVFKSAFSFAAKNEELLFLLSLMIMFFFAMIYAYIGFGIVIGAFVAGLLLGNLPYNLEIGGRTKALKDFFSVIFFVSIGLGLTAINLKETIVPVIVMLAITVIVLPAFTLFVLALFGYKKRTAFLASISLAQISEFSLIIASIGLAKGVLTSDIYNATIFLAIITIAITAYFIKYDGKLYELIGRRITWFEKLGKRNANSLSNISEDGDYDVILAGYDRTGYSIFKQLRKMKKKVVVIDLNPDVIKGLIEENIPCIYGDISDPEIMNKLKIQTTELIISTIPDHSSSALLIMRVREKNPEATVILTSYSAEGALDLYEKGADYVLVPHFLGGEYVGILLQNTLNRTDKLLQVKIRHIKELEEKKRRHPHHD